MVLAAGQGEERARPSQRPEALGFCSLSEEPQTTPEISEYREQIPSPWPLSLEVGLAGLFPRGVKMTHSQDSPGRTQDLLLRPYLNS